MIITGCRSDPVSIVVDRLIVVGFSFISEEKQVSLTVTEHYLVSTHGRYPVQFVH